MSNIIRWGILGSGAVAFKFCQDLQKVQDASFYGVASRKIENAKTFADQFSGVHTYANYDDLLKDSSIDAIYIATPPFTHKDLCIKGFENNKHVLCEKPFALNSTELKEVIASAAKYKKFCMEGMWMRFIPLMRKVKALIDAGEIGEIRLIRADLGHSLPLWEDHFSNKHSEGGGALMDLGVYLLSLAYQLLGKPDKVSSNMLRGPTNVDEFTSVVLTYKNAIAVLTTTIRSTLENNCTIVGTKGTISICSPLYSPSKFTLKKNPISQERGHSGFLNNFPRVKNLLKPILKRDEGKFIPFTGYGYHYEAAEVMDCIRNHKLESCIMPLADSLAVMELIDAVFQQNPFNPGR